MTENAGRLGIEVDLSINGRARDAVVAVGRAPTRELVGVVRRVVRRQCQQAPVAWWLALGLVLDLERPITVAYVKHMPSRGGADGDGTGRPLVQERSQSGCPDSSRVGTARPGGDPAERRTPTCAGAFSEAIVAGGARQTTTARGSVPADRAAGSRTRGHLRWPPARTCSTPAFSPTLSGDRRDPSPDGSPSSARTASSPALSSPANCASARRSATRRSCR